MRLLLRCIVGLATLVLAGVSSTVSADETTFCNFLVKSLPFSANLPGRYCFVTDLTTAAGTAIWIFSDDVTIDLNRFRLDGSLAGPGTQTVGIYADGRQRVNVRNGTISGFQRGIYLIGPGTNHVLVEDIRAEGNTAFGIQVFGDDTILRNCTVTDTGGSTVAPNFAFGINTAGNNVQIINNSVVHTFALSLAAAIASDQSDAMLFSNRIFDVSGGTTNVGILCNGGGVTALIRDNTVISAATPYQGCQRIGTNNFP